MRAKKAQDILKQAQENAPDLTEVHAGLRFAAELLQLPPKSEDALMVVLKPGNMARLRDWCPSDERLCLDKLQVVMGKRSDLESAWGLPENVDFEGKNECFEFLGLQNVGAYCRRRV